MTAIAVIMIIVWIFVIIVVITGGGKPPKDEFVKPDEPPRSYKNTPSPRKNSSEVVNTHRKVINQGKPVEHKEGGTMSTSDISEVEANISPEPPAPPTPPVPPKPPAPPVSPTGAPSPGLSKWWAAVSSKEARKEAEEAWAETKRLRSVVRARREEQIGKRVEQLIKEGKLTAESYQQVWNELGSGALPEAVTGLGFSQDFSDVSDTVLKLLDSGRISWPKSVSDRNKFIAENILKVWDALLEINVDANVEVLLNLDEPVDTSTSDTASYIAWDALTKVLMLVLILEDALGIDITLSSKYDEPKFSVSKAKIRSKLRL